MNRYTLEKALWDVVSDPARAAALRETPGQFLGGYRMAEDESALLRDMDVKAMLALGINSMLVMRAFQMVHGRDQLPQYLKRLAKA